MLKKIILGTIIASISLTGVVSAEKVKCEQCTKQNPCPQVIEEEYIDKKEHVTHWIYCEEGKWKETYKEPTRWFEPYKPLISEQV